uniref:Chitin-binding type-2 domain-containing protein n=1 Tax=Meloidogyne enterolobii TaxID=390850 RepID=A0A6V7W2Z5_MELEN|nr:unnamed protein product [Meloidogyne enterolobii]
MDLYGTTIYLFNCPLNLKYSQKASQCDYDENVPECSGKQLKNPKQILKIKENPISNQCINLFNGIYGENCSSYYFICLNSQIYDYKCPENYLFNKNTKNCLLKEYLPECKNEEMLKTIVVF